MKIPSVKISQYSLEAAEKIIEASKNKISIGEQMKMSNYYAFLHSKSNLKNDNTNFARLLIGK